MLKVGQKGIAQIFLLLFLVIGLLIGLYVVKQTQILHSRANSISADSAKTSLLQNASAPYDEFNNQLVMNAQATDPSYQVEYQPEFDQFILVIYKTPIEQVRQAAEQDVIAQSGKDLDQLCALNFTVMAPSFVAGGENYVDSSLDVCKKKEPVSEDTSILHTDSLQLSGLSVPALPEEPLKFSSDLQIVTNEQLPQFVYIKLCRNEGNSAEGVWQIGKDPLIADFLYNQLVQICDNPTPNYLVFTQPVPEGTLISLCQSRNLPLREWVWKVNPSGYIADYVASQDGCTLPPSSEAPQTSRNAICTTGDNFCSVNFLRKYFPDDEMKLAEASQICSKESAGISSIVAPDGGVGLFQISIPSHGQTIKYWQNVKNNINKAIELSGSGQDWYAWSTAYDYGCWDNHRIPACGFIKGHPNWQNDCPI